MLLPHGINGGLRRYAANPPYGKTETLQPCGLLKPSSLSDFTASFEDNPGTAQPMTSA